MFHLKNTNDSLNIKRFRYKKGEIDKIINSSNKLWETLNELLLDIKLEVDKLFNIMAIDAINFPCCSLRSKSKKETIFLGPVILKSASSL